MCFLDTSAFEILTASADRRANRVVTYSDPFPRQQLECTRRRRESLTRQSRSLPPQAGRTVAEMSVLSMVLIV